MLFKKSALVLAASLLAVGAAHAAPPATTANLNVNINVTASSVATACSILGMAMMSPTVNASYISGAVAAEVVQSSSLTLSCNGTDAVSYSISAGAGNNASGTTRRALFSGNYVDYQLHLAGMMYPAVGAIWDTAAPTFGGSVMTGSTAPSGSSSTAYLGFSVKVPANQIAPSGMYTDVVLLTATF